MPPYTFIIISIVSVSYKYSINFKRTITTKPVKCAEDMVPKYPEHIIRIKALCQMESDAVDISRWNPQLEND